MLTLQIITWKKTKHSLFSEDRIINNEKVAPTPTANTYTQTHRNMKKDDKNI